MLDFLKRFFSGNHNSDSLENKGCDRGMAKGVSSSVEVTEEDGLAGRIEFEYEMSQLKAERQIRLVGTPEFALTRLMELSGVAVSQISNVWCYVIIQDWNGTSSCKIEDYKAYSIFEHLVKKTPAGKYELFGLARHVTLWLEYATPTGEIGSFCAHCGVTGLSRNELHLMNRVAIMHKIPGKPQVFTNKIMMTFDETDAQPWRDKLEEIRCEAERKLEEKVPLNQVEEAITGGCHTVPSLMAMGNDKFEDGAWSDAIYHYLQVYRLLHHSVYTEKAPNFIFDDFMNACYKLGACYLHKGLYVKAYYYLSLSAAGSTNPDVEVLLEKCNAGLQLFSKPEPTEVETKMMSRLMFMLHFCFDITSQEIAALYWLDPAAQKGDLIEDPEDIAKFDIREVMHHHEELVLQLSYRASSLQCSSGNAYDKSRLQSDHCVILLLSKQDGIITVSSMLPQFTNGDLESYQQNASLQFYLDDVFNASAFEQLRVVAQQHLKDNEELYQEEVFALGNFKLAHYYHLNGGYAFEQKVWGEALYNEYIAKNLLLAVDHTAEVDDFDKLAWRDVNYNIGFAFMEMKNYIPAIHYLMFVAECESFSYMAEFFNSLTLEKDIRSRAYLDLEYDKVVKENAYPHLTGEERTQYIAYLKRRKGYVMTDQGNFDKAVPFLTSLLDDPLCTESAKNELEYIRQHYHQE